MLSSLHLRSFLSYTPPVSIKSCFPSFFVKFVSLRWAEEHPSRLGMLFYFLKHEKSQHRDRYWLSGW